MAYLAKMDEVLERCARGEVGQVDGDSRLLMRKQTNKQKQDMTNEITMPWRQCEDYCAV